jgi:hypothetical protein
MKRLLVAVCYCIVFALVLQVNFAQTLQEPDTAKADSMAEKIQQLRSGYDQEDADPMELEVSEEEANAYIALRLTDQLPEGVLEPWVKFTDGPVIAGALLDLDVLQNRMPPSTLTRYMTGRVPVELTASLQTGAGIGKVILESVSLGGIPLPSSFVQDLVTTYTKSPSRPNGVRLDEPFELPYAIESVTTKKGLILIKQRGAKQTPSSRHP